MAKRHGPTKAQRAKLLRLPRNEALVIEGGMRALTVAGRKRGETTTAQLTIWLNGGEQFVRSIAVIDAGPTADDATVDALGSLVTACTGPFPQPAPALQAQASETDNTALTPASGDHSRTALTPTLPAKVLVNDAALVTKAAEIFDPLGVPVEYVESLPAFDEAYAAFAQYLGVQPEREAKPFAWKIDASLLPPLFDAAAEFWRRSPWRYLPDHPPFLVKVGRHGPQTGVQTLYASIMGAAGVVRGVAFYFAMEGMRQAMDLGLEIQAQDADVDLMIEMLRQYGAPVDEVPREMLRAMVGGMMSQAGAGGRALPDSLALYYASLKEVDPAYADWLGKHGLTYRSRQSVPLFTRTVSGAEPRWPNAREVRALTVALQVLNRYFRSTERLLQDPFLPLLSVEYPLTLEVGGRRETFTVTFPPPDWAPEEDDPDWALEDESSDPFEPELPATEAGTRAVYRFLVTLEWKPDVWRRIEVRGDQTLHDLHEAIQDAFEWDDDHLYAFFLSGKPWDSVTAYESPNGDGRSAAAFRLEHLPLHARQRIMYIFDFGDDLRHIVRLEAIVPGGARPDAAYPHVVETHGAPVPQYPDADPES